MSRGWFTGDKRRRPPTQGRRRAERSSPLNLQLQFPFLLLLLPKNHVDASNPPPKPHNGHPDRPIPPPHRLPLPPHPLLLPLHLPRNPRLPKPRLHPRRRDGDPRPPRLPLHALPGLHPRGVIPRSARHRGPDELRVGGRGGKPVLEQPGAGAVGVFLCGHGL